MVPRVCATWLDDMDDSMRLFTDMNYVCSSVCRW